MADNAASELSRFAGASAKLFAEQAAAMAVMTAYGMTVAAQMTGMMLGALRGPARSEASEEPRPADANASAAQKSSGEVVELRPRAPGAEPAPVPEASEKPARKAATPVKARAASKPALRGAAAAGKSKSAATGRDDLKRISGIGPRLEQELNARAITRYADIAALSKAAVKKLDTELGLDGRIARDDWAGQAKALSGGKG